MCHTSWLLENTWFYIFFFDVLFIFISIFFYFKYDFSGSGKGFDSITPKTILKKSNQSIGVVNQCRIVLELHVRTNVAFHRRSLDVDCFGGWVFRFICSLRWFGIPQNMDVLLLE